MISENKVLPALRKKIFRHYAFIVGLFGVVGTLLVIVSVIVATGLTPRALHRNYDSIEAAHKMQEALNAINHPDEFEKKSKDDWIRQFERALHFEFNNLTEHGEEVLSTEIKENWQRFLEGDTSPQRLQHLHESLQSLIKINEQGMFGYVNEGLSLRRNIVLIAFLLFFMILGATLYLADGLAERIAKPLRTIAEALRSKPTPGNKLKLPDPTSLEIKILVEELALMWQRISKTDQLKVEEIDKQRKKLLTLLTAVEDAILVLDSQDKITHVNLRMAEILGLPERDLIGQRWSDLSTSSENYMKLREILSVELSDSNSFELESSPGKLPRTFAARTRLVEGIKGQESKIYLLHDITELKQRERLKAEFIGVLSHELKTPIQSLSTASDLLTEAAKTTDERIKLLSETIAEDVSRIRGVAQDFVQVTEVSGSSIRVKPELCPVSELLPQWIKPFQVIAKDKRVEIEYRKIGSDKILAKIDPVKFPWVISNLVSNAVRVAPLESKIEVKLTDRNGYCEVSVSDEGPGISSEVQRRMFDPYYQGKSTSSEATQLSGMMGMGLTIAKEITEAHNGRLEYSMQRTKGSLFRVLLPLQG